MRRDAAHPPAHCERHLDDLVEGRRVAGGTPGAGILVLVYALQGRAGVEHAATARAQHIPGQLENPEPGGVEEGCDRTLFVETPLCGKFQNVNAAECAIRGILNQLLNGIHGVGIGRLAQNRKQIFGFAHGPILCRIVAR